MDSREKTSFATMGRSSSGISIKFLGSGQTDSDPSGGGGGGLGRNLSLRAMGKAGSAANTLNNRTENNYSTIGNNSGYNLSPASSGYASTSTGNPNNGARSGSYGFTGGTPSSGTPVKQGGTFARQKYNSAGAGDQEDVNHQLNAVKLKLEERRRKIEEEKKKMEQLMVKQREKVGQEAFLRAVSRGIRRVESQGQEGLEQESSSSGGIKQEILDLAHTVTKVNSVNSPGHTSHSSNDGFSTGGGASNVSARKAGFNLRLSSGESSKGDDLKTPDVESMDISRMSDSLHSIQSDIQRLAMQQSQIQNIMSHQQRGGSQEPDRKSFYISQPEPQEKHQRGFFISEDRLGANAMASPGATEEMKTATTVRRTWGTPQPVLLPPSGEQQHRQQYQQHHNQGHPSANDQYSSVYSAQAEQFPVHHVPERPTLLNQSINQGGYHQQYQLSGQQQQFSGYNQQQQQQQPLLNGQSPGGSAYHNPPYGRPLSAPGGAQSSGYMGQPPVSAAGYSGYPSQYGYAEPYGTTMTHPHNTDPSISVTNSQAYLHQQQQHHIQQQHQQQHTQQTYEGPGTVRINLSRNNSFNRHLHLQQQQQPVSSVYGGSSHYAEPVYAEPPMATTYSGGNLPPAHSNLTPNLAGMGASGMMGATSPGGGRIKSSPPFTQVEERSMVPPAIAEKPNLATLPHFQQRQRNAATRHSGSPMTEHQRPVENLYESVDHGYNHKSRSPSPPPIHQAPVEHYYETLDRQMTPPRSQVTPPRSYSSPRSSLTMNINRSGRTSLEADPRQQQIRDFSSPSTLNKSREMNSPAVGGSSQKNSLLGLTGTGLETGPGAVEEPEMTSSTIETLSDMKTETLGDTNDAKGFVISFGNDSPVRPKPVLKQKRTSRRESLVSGISNDSTISDRKDSTPAGSQAKTPDGHLENFSTTNLNNTPYTASNLASNLASKLTLNGAANSNLLVSPFEPQVVTSPSAAMTSPPAAMTSLSAAREESQPDIISHSEKCVLCETSAIQQPLLKLCSKCTNVLKANIDSPDALLRCNNSGACDPEDYCPKCMIEKTKSLNMFEEVRDTFQDASPTTSASKLDEKKMEWVQMMTLKRKQQAEESRIKREEEARMRREEDEAKKAEQTRKKEEEKRRKEEILQQYKIKKELEKEDKAPSHPPPTSSNRTGPRMRPRSAGAGKPRPRTIHGDPEDIPDGRGGGVVRSASGLRGSHSNLNISSLNRSRNYRRGSNTSLHDEELYDRGSGIRGLGHIGRSKSSSVSNLGPGSLPLGLRRGPGLSGGQRSDYGGHRGDEFDDRASDISSTTSGYRSGRVSARLFREPVSKSNRPIIMNAIEFVVFPGAVNRDTRMRVLEEIEQCDCPHFLLLFRDNRLQFRALYAFYPDTEEVFKIHGNGPKQIGDNMIDTYYKYNSGGKKFTQIHTKHLTVTIDAFTIHNSLWLGKKTRLPDKKGLPLVI